jgi:hypothetical protein
MKFSRILATTLIIGLLSACSYPKSDLMSPCVGAEGSPCGPRVPVNDWWLHPSEKS